MSEQKQFIGNTDDLNNTQILNKSAFLNVWGTSPQKHFRLFVLYFEKNTDQVQSAPVGHALHFGDSARPCLFFFTWLSKTETRVFLKQPPNNVLHSIMSRRGILMQIQTYSIVPKWF